MAGTVTERIEATRRFRLSGLWRNADFLKLWGAQSVSIFGSEITVVALPLLAALVLGATPLQMGLLVAAEGLPFLLCSLPAGVWVDRARRRPFLIAADLGRAALLLAVPLLALLGWLRIEYLYIIAFGAGTFAALFDVAHYAYVPALLRREELVEGNSKLQMSYSVAEAGGPGVAGVIVQLLSSPVALVVDAATYVVSALFLRAIKTPEPPPAPSDGTSLRQSIGEGMRALVGHPLLRPIILGSITAVVFSRGIVALFILLATRELGIGAAAIGLIFAAGGLGAIPGAALAGPVARRCGVGAAIIGGWAIEGAALLLIPLAAWWGGGPGTVAILAAGKLIGGIAMAVANVNQWSLRQVVTPDRLQGRVTASHRTLVYGAQPLGALLGGLLGTAIGLAPAILVCAVGTALAPLWAVFSPLRRLRDQPLRDH
jgi:MFS family permease